MLLNQAGGVTVDPHFLRVGGRSYSIKQINAVGVTSGKPHTNTRPIIIGIFLFPFAAITLILMFSPFPEGAITTGLITLILLWPFILAIKRSRKVLHQLSLITSSGNVQVVSSSDRGEIDMIRDTIERAISGDLPNT